MKPTKPLGGVVLVVLGFAALGVLGTLGGLGVDSRLIGSDWQLAALVALLFLAGAFGVYAALGRPWRSMQTPYW